MDPSGQRRLVLAGSLGFTAFLVGGVVGALVVWFTHSQRLNDSEFLEKQLQSLRPDGGKPASGAPPALVRIAQAEWKLFSPQRETIGRLVEVRKVTVASEVTGTIAVMPLEEGSRVIAGETVVARIDDVWSRLARERIRAQIESAEVMLSYERGEWQRLRKLVETHSQVITESELMLKEATVTGLEARLRENQAALEEENERIARSTIRAPFDGVVVAKHAELGGHVTAGTPLVDIVAGGQLDARMMVPESAVNLLRVGQPLGVRIDALREEVEGTVVSVTPYGPSASRTFPVRVRVEDHEGRLKAGMSVTVEFPMGSPREALVVSRDAVLIRPDGATVWVTTKPNGSETVEVQPVPVAVGARMGNEYAVEAETAAGRALLLDGARVVVEGAERLMPGQRVRIVTLEEASPVATLGDEDASPCVSLLQKRPEAPPEVRMAGGPARVQED